MAVLLYDAERTDRRLSLVDVNVDGLDDDQLLWVDVVSEDELDSAVDRFGLADETARAIREPANEPALFVYDGYVHVVTLTPDDGVANALHAVVGPNWVLTLHREPLAFLDRFDERIRADSDLGKLDGYGLLAAILQEHVGSYLAELRPLEAALDRIDLRTMTGRIDEEGLLRELVRTRLQLAKLRRRLAPHRELFALLARSEFTVLSGSRAASDFEALNELLERALQSMETTREMIAGSFEIYTTWTAHGTNKVMKWLTVVSVALLPPTLLAGVMGMNSLPHSLANGTAFEISIALIAALPLAVLGIAKRQRVI